MATKINVKNESILENIIETLQCFKCKAVPGITQEQQNRYTCVNESHQLCEKCKSVCQCGSVVGKRPNPTTKKLLKDLPVYCPHHKNGCRQIFVQTQAESLDDHQQGCLFNKVFCPDLYCKKKVLFKDVIEHLIQVHELYQGKFLVATKYKCKIVLSSDNLGNGAVWFPKSIMISSGIEFFFVGKIIKKIAHFWLYAMTSPLQAKHYAYTLSITGENNKFTFDGYSKSLDEDPSEIIENQLVFMIGTEAIKKIRNEENMFEIEVTIHDLKAEAREDNEEHGVEDESE
mgnify:CR=1 FL=1